MQLIADLDPYSPDEDEMEVLIGEMSTWGIIEAQVLFPALELAFDGAEATINPARDRLSTLYDLQASIHENENAEEPFDELAGKYISGVKFHLLADVQEMVPLAVQLPAAVSRELAHAMEAMKLELE